ncbi:MAG: hypothetical protein ACFCU8_12100 [Thermosynechococcaceae cyanobacterium]
MNSRTTRKFREAFAKLPKLVQEQARAAYHQFQDEDPADYGFVSRPSLTVTLELQPEYA